MDSLNQFIEQAAKAGSLDSDGVFTLDVDRAGDKIKKFQLVDPYLYAAHLVSAAVLGGGLKVILSRSASQLSWAFDGRNFERDHLENLSQGLVPGYSGDRRLQELAIAVSGARATSPSRLLLESVDSHGKGVSMEYLGDSRRVEFLTGRQPGNRLILEYPVTWKRLAGRFDSKSPEVDVLKRFCSRAPLLIRSDLEQITVPTFLGEGFLAWKSYRGASVDPGIPVPRKGGEYCASVSWRQPFSAVLAFTNPLYAEVHGLTIVLNGVAFRREKVLACPFACGVVHVTHLHKNISHTDLAEDHLYSELLDLLKAKVDELWREVADHNVTLSGGYRDKVVDYLIRRYPEADRPLSIRRYLFRLDMDKELGSSDKGHQLLDDAAALEAWGEREQAVMLRTKVLDGAGRLLVRDYPHEFGVKSVRTSELYARALHELNGSPSPAAQELHSVVSALSGSNAPVDWVAGDDWQRFRASLVAMLLNDLDRARQLVSEMETSFPWRWYVAAELDGNLDFYRKATRLAPASAYLWNEAAGAFRHAGRYREAIGFRSRALECLPSNEPHFIRLLAREASGKASFATWVKWSVLAQFRPAEHHRVTELAKSFEKDMMLSHSAVDSLRNFSPMNLEYLYLEHLLRWSWRRNQTTPNVADLRFVARNLLLRSLEVRISSLALVELRT